MEIKLIFKNGRQTYVNVKDLSQSEVEKAINAEEDRFGSVVTKVDQSEVQEHGAGGFIIGAVAGGYLTNLVMKEGVKGASKTVAKGVNKIAKATASAVKKVSSKSSKSKKKSSTPVTRTSAKKPSSKKPSTPKADVPKAPAKKNIRYISNSLIRSIDLKGGKRIFNKDIIDGAHLNKGINIPANNGYSKKPKNLREDRTLSSQTDYLSSRRIDSVQTTFGKRIPGSQVKDGAYVKDGVLFENGGLIDPSSFTKDEFFKVVNNWVYFTYNYPHNFVKSVFSNSHFESKFNSAYERHGSGSAVVSFWHELDTENQKELAIWVKNNYFNYKSEEENLKAISDDAYAEIIYIWNRFCYNYPHTFVTDALTSNPSHFESKFTRSYEKYGSRGAVNNFFTELSTDLQRKLTDWVYDYYSAHKFANGGSTDTQVAQTILQQIGGRNRVNIMTGAYNFLADTNALSFRIKNPKANYIKIKLNGKDLYDIEIGKVHGLNYKIVKTYNDVYAEDLISRLEEGTGMYFRFEDGGMVDSFGGGGSTGEKIFSIKPTSIGKAKYVIDYHDGVSTHKDGSKFIGIDTYSSKEKLQKGIKRFLEDGYRQVNSVFKVLHDGKDYEQGGSTPNPHAYTYMLLSRLQSDCEYFLNHGGRSERNLWALSVDAQIEEMKKLWNSLPEDGKPEWLTMEQIEEYEKQMKDDSKEYELGGRVSEHEGTKYFTYNFENKGNNWEITVVWGKSNYISVLKKTNNPFGGRIGNRYNNLEDALDHYKDMNIKAQIIFAVEEAEKHGYVPEKYADGGALDVLLAPNGQPSNLTPTQYHLVRTPEFKSWFGDWENDPETASKVVDENGEPLVVYHGSLSKFTKFRTKNTYIYYKDSVGKKQKFFWSTSGSLGEGAYFTSTKDFALQYTGGGYGEMGSDGFLYEVFLNLRNPSLGSLNNPKIHDGAIGIGGEEDIYMATNPKQIKLADGSNTTFDSDNSDIRYETGGTTYAPLNSVEVIFEDPKHNYTTSVASSLTEDEARSYFVGKRFNVASYPREQFERVIDIKFTKGDGSQFANGGSIEDYQHKRYFPKSVDGYVFAKPVEEAPNNLVPIEYTGVGIFDSLLGMFVALDNDGKMVPYLPAGGYSTAEEIANQMNSGEIAQHAIYTVPHLFYKFAQDITLRPLEVDPLYTQLQRHTGSHNQAHNFFNVESKGAFDTTSNGGRGQMIENKELGIRLMMSSKLYEYIDGYNMFISNYGGDKTIRTYPENYLVASIKEDGTLDFDVMDKAISLDRSKVKEAFEKGYIPTTSYRLIDHLKNSGITELPDYLKPRV